MKTTSFHSREFPNIGNLIRFIILIAILCFLTCLISSAQVPTKTCCKAYYHINFDEIKQFLDYLDSIGGIEDCHRRRVCKWNKPQELKKTEYMQERTIYKGGKSACLYYFDELYADINKRNRIEELQCIRFIW